jgi:uncharacterized protein (TIGR02996 family)
MGDDRAILAAIRSRPDDDGPRLALADWLQEHGDEDWAELIRVQVELARPTPERPASRTIHLFSPEGLAEQIEQWDALEARRARLAGRERQLLTSARVPVPEGWAVRVGLGVAPVTRGERGDLFLRRGLAERAACFAGVWVADGDSVLAEQPVESVRLLTRPVLAQEGDRTGFRGDPTGRMFTAAELRASYPSGVARAADAIIQSLLRCRWPGLTFDVLG